MPDDHERRLDQLVRDLGMARDQCSRAQPVHEAAPDRAVQDLSRRVRFSGASASDASSTRRGSRKALSPKSLEAVERARRGGEDRRLRRSRLGVARRHRRVRSLPWRTARARSRTSCTPTPSGSTAATSKASPISSRTGASCRHPTSARTIEIVGREAVLGCIGQRPVSTKTALRGRVTSRRNAIIEVDDEQAPPPRGATTPCFQQTDALPASADHLRPLPRHLPRASTAAGGSTRA